MNKIYKKIWNSSRQAMVVVDETRNNRTSGSGKPQMAAAFIMLALCTPFSVNAEYVFNSDGIWLHGEDAQYVSAFQGHQGEDQPSFLNLASSGNPNFYNGVYTSTNIAHIVMSVRDTAFYLISNNAIGEQPGPITVSQYKIGEIKADNHSSFMLAFLDGCQNLYTAVGASIETNKITADSSAIYGLYVNGGYGPMSAPEFTLNI